jgi:hypothetical protein
MVNIKRSAHAINRGYKKDETAKNNTKPKNTSLSKLNLEREALPSLYINSSPEKK